MPTDTTVNNLIINKLTKAQYDAISEPSDTELYLVPDNIDAIPTSGSDNPVTSGGVYSALGDKQDTLVSGTNLKTINNQSLLGSGNISISGGGGGGGEENVIESISVNGTPQTVVDKNVDLSIPAEITTNAFIGSFERTNVSGSGNVTIYNTVGYFPAVPGDGSYEVTTYAKSSTTSYTLSVTFGSNTYSLTPTDGEISDTRTLTLQSGDSWSATISSAASGTTVGAIVNLPGSVVTSVGRAAVTNDYNDLFNLPDLTLKQDKLVSGTNIKTINNTSLLGSGNITISGGSGEANVIEIVKVNGSALTPDANKAVDITVPTISTSITTDATSDTKTASPKAVKTYVDGIVGDIETLLAAI